MTAITPLFKIPLCTDVTHKQRFYTTLQTFITSLYIFRLWIGSNFQRKVMYDNQKNTLECQIVGSYGGQFWPILGSRFDYFKTYLLLGIWNGNCFCWKVMQWWIIETLVGSYFAHFRVMFWPFIICAKISCYTDIDWLLLHIQGEI